MKQVLAGLLIFIGLCQLTLAAPIDPLAELGQAELKELKLAKMIFKTQKVADSPWPRLKIFQQLEGRPLQAIGIFSAYEYQTEYIPNLILSKVIKVISAVEVHTQYEMKMPWPLPNGRYVNGHKLEKLGPNSFRLNWYLVRSNSASETTGSASFYPLGDKTVMVYSSYIRPKSFLAPLFRGFFYKDTKASINSIAGYIKKTLGDPKKTTKLLGLAKSALAGKSPY
ncbi:MAG: hypothetical protein HN509_18680 [Halobacteriovoraceae bacterium]|jgi:hypothetical protein|nr:hypothetical protein [Halobacteriovoraceae bacterium]MBT5093195.1 hypothetical protein [Halobacteriovoraceae bacterium]